jgi:hypothetical protein
MNPKKRSDNCHRAHSHQWFSKCNKMLPQSCKLLVTLSHLEVMLGLSCLMLSMLKKLNELIKFFQS